MTDPWHAAFNRSHPHPMTKTRIRHIPADTATTYHRRALCGRWLRPDRFIDLATTALDEAECKACQRVDDAQQIREYKE